jgi:DNA-directed RNA polymerase specialized sigma24 family protein
VNGGEHYDRESVEARLLAGDPKAVEIVSRTVARAVARSRFRPLRDEWSDLRQEVFRRVIESLRKRLFDPRHPFEAYVRGIARYVALEALERRSRKRQQVDSHLPVRDDRSSVDLYNSCLVACLMPLLSPLDRSLLRLFYLEQKSHAEIDVRVGTIKSRLFRCLGRAHHILAGPTRHERESGLPGEAQSLSRDRNTKSGAETWNRNLQAPLRQTCKWEKLRNGEPARKGWLSLGEGSRTRQENP